MSRLTSLLLLSLLCVFTISIDARGDWPGWMGAGRDNQPVGVELPDDLSKQSPKLVWKQSAAGGYAGPAVVNGKLFITDYVTGDDVSVANFERKSFTGEERVRCLDAESGEEIWSYRYPVKYTVSYPAGPRCTPNVDGAFVYTLGTEGDLICFEIASGEIVWKKSLTSEYGTKAALWGYASHPLIDGDRLICVAGGEGSHVVAFDKKSGEELWRQGSATEQGYVPPTIVEAGGARQLIIGSPDQIRSLNPETGSEYWSVPYQASNGSIIMSPLTTVVDSKTYLYMGGYSNKNLLLELSDDQPAAEVVWRDINRAGISPVNVQPFIDGDMIYGFDQNGTLMGVRLPSGDRLWSTSEPISKRPMGSATAFIVRPKGEDRFILFTELGDLVIGTMTPEGFTEQSRAHVIEPTGVAFGRRVVWSAPAHAGSRIYMRNDKEIVCFDLKP
ncbi:MAG: PQQ-binding-like beta-propeller repeat protein [Planctomycetota bacterium]